ncbi:hypothetical protein MIND_00312200 [Mycena indigotica]|uniref:Uncharacterized protein n=1 Tax=Mycena indigotica TaxID=2126181 RepID=A0A8H6WEF6_9AGAR|nr:uncharacterized protein MIND_00312200 [Mycena indigotica]KAF7309414.1 hypothetical protein MIND_00312200 [Mycena indigotica]
MASTSSHQPHTDTWATPAEGWTQLSQSPWVLPTRRPSASWGLQAIQSPQSVWGNQTPASAPNIDIATPRNPWAGDIPAPDAPDMPMVPLPQPWEQRKDNNVPGRKDNLPTLPSAPWEISNVGPLPNDYPEPLIVATNPFDRPTRKTKKHKSVRFQQTPDIIQTRLTLTPPPPSPTLLPIDPASIPLPPSETSSRNSTVEYGNAPESILLADREPIYSFPPGFTPPISPRPLLYSPSLSQETLPWTLSYPSQTTVAAPPTPPKTSIHLDVADGLEESILPLPVTTSPKAIGPLYQIMQTLGSTLREAANVESGLQKVYEYVMFLRLPSLYFSRVARVFEDAETSKPDIQRMLRAGSKHRNRSMRWVNHNPTLLTPTLITLLSSWEVFIDSLMREWKTLNVVSVLLMSAILTLLQIDSAAHPITRSTALFSLMCSLFSLLYGCMYIIRFGTMRTIHKAASFAHAIDANGDVNLWWNVWIMLAMPLTWLAWSIITFLASIMSFVWLTGSSQDSFPALSKPAALGVRLALTFVVVFGIVYFVLIVREFQRYGDALDRVLSKAGEGTPASAKLGTPGGIYGPWTPQRWPQQQSPPFTPYANPVFPPWAMPYGSPQNFMPPPSPGFIPPPGFMPQFPGHGFIPPPTPTFIPSPTFVPSPALSPAAFPVGAPSYFSEMMPTFTPPTTVPRAFSEEVSSPTTHGAETFTHPYFPIIALGSGVGVTDDWMSEGTQFPGLQSENRIRFAQDVASAWSGKIRLEGQDPQSSLAPQYVTTAAPPANPAVVQEFMDLWNARYFSARNLEVTLAQSLYHPAGPGQYVVGIRSVQARDSEKTSSADEEAIPTTSRSSVDATSEPD